MAIQVRYSNSKAMLVLQSGQYKSNNDAQTKKKVCLVCAQTALVRYVQPTEFSNYQMPSKFFASQILVTHIGPQTNQPSTDSHSLQIIKGQIHMHIKKTFTKFHESSSDFNSCKTIVPLPSHQVYLKRNNIKRYIKTILDTLDIHGNRQIYGDFPAII